MTVNLSVTLRMAVQSAPEPPPDPTPNLRRVRKWGDPVMVDLLAADTSILPASTGYSNFQAVQLSTVDANGRAWFGAVSQFQRLDEQAREYLRSLQYASDGYTERQKMNWLGEGSEKGRPYFEKASGLAFGTIAFGGQLIEIDPTEYRFKTKYPAQERDMDGEVFYRIEGFRRADIGRGYTYATHPHLINRATMAYYGNGTHNLYSDKPKGEIFHPVWDVRDYPHNETTRDPGLFIAARFLE